MAVGLRSAAKSQLRLTRSTPLSQSSTRCSPSLAARSFSTTPARRSAGLTNILASEDDPERLSISKQTVRGFHLTDDLLVPGGLVLLEGTPFLWNVDPPNIKAKTLPEFWKGWDTGAFKVFEIVVPRPGALAASGTSSWIGANFRNLVIRYWRDCRPTT